jgi:hypothetical protein
VLSAAHCFVGVKSPPTHVRLGEHDTSTANDGATAEDVPIKRSITHERYSATDLQNDIAVVVLERAVAFRPGVRPVCLPNQVNLYFKKKNYAIHSDIKHLNERSSGFKEKSL